MSYGSAVPVWAQILMDGPVHISGSVHENPQATRGCLVLLAHGSKDPRWREPFERIFLHARKDCEQVKLAYMEFIGPTLFEIAEGCAAEGVEHLQVLPLFMAAGAHLATDVPEQVEQIRVKHPKLTIDVLPPIGEDPRIACMMRRIIDERLQGF